MGGVGLRVGGEGGWGRGESWGKLEPTVLEQQLKKRNQARFNYF